MAQLFPKPRSIFGAAAFAGVALVAIGAFGGAGPAAAQSPASIGTNGDWQAYTFKRDGAVVCYMASSPTKSLPDGAKRDPIYTLVTNDPKAKVHGEVSIVAGYPIKEGGPFTAAIGGDTFQMVTQKDRAWTEGPEADAKMVQAMAAGASMTVKGISSRGTETTDTYSLSGFTATKKLIDDKCK